MNYSFKTMIALILQKEEAWEKKQFLQLMLELETLSADAQACSALSHEELGPEPQFSVSTARHFLR